MGYPGGRKGARATRFGAEPLLARRAGHRWDGVECGPERRRPPARGCGTARPHGGAVRVGAAGSGGGLPGRAGGNGYCKNCAEFFLSRMRPLAEGGGRGGPLRGRAGVGGR